MPPPIFLRYFSKLKHELAPMTDVSSCKNVARKQVVKIPLKKGGFLVLLFYERTRWNGIMKKRKGAKYMTTYSVSFSKEKRIQSLVEEGPYMVKALSLAAGELLPKHETPHHLYLQCLEGAPTITLFDPEEKLVLKPHSLLRIEAKRQHAVEAGEQQSLLLLHLVKVL